MSYSHCGKCRGLVAETDHACRICNRPIDRVPAGAVASGGRGAHPMSQTAPGRPGRRRPHQLETFLRGTPVVDAEVLLVDDVGPSGSASAPLRSPFLSAPPPSSFASAPQAGASDAIIDLTPAPPARPPSAPGAAPVERAAPAWAVPATALRPDLPRPVSTRPAIVVQGLRKTYGEGDLAVAAVRDIDFEVREGEVVLIMGPSGSGKTTLLLMLGAMLRPTAGSVVIGGTPVSSVPERQLPKVRARHLGFIFQDFNLLSALTAQENVELACNLAGVQGRRAAARSAELLERVGLGHRLGFRPNQLSGGEKQRVAVARALANDPPLLLADEPTANLDSTHGKSIGQLLRRLADEDGRTSLIVTHDDRLTEIADRVLWLEDGTIRPADHGRGRA